MPGLNGPINGTKEIWHLAIRRFERPIHLVDYQINSFSRVHSFFYGGKSANYNKEKISNKICWF